MLVAANEACILCRYKYRKKTDKLKQMPSILSPLKDKIITFAEKKEYMTKTIKTLLLAVFTIAAGCATAQEHSSNLPYFTSGPIQYGMISEEPFYQGEATVQRCVDKSVKSLNIPYNVSRGLTNWHIGVIAPGAFECCAIESIKLSDDIKFIESSAFRWTHLKSFRCPAKLRGVGMNAFAWCTELEEFITDANLKAIGASCFRGCTKLKRFDCPKDMHTIGDFAFNSCSSLEYVTMGDDMINIGHLAFDAVPNLKAIAITNTNPHDAKDAFSQDVLQRTWLVVPDGCTAKYRAREGWKDFVHITEFGQLEKQ